mmetsp:Transcript_14342/g.29240  ORF Transcript_14342/g.29240 Transcript_14342/m.29240 type:complete len:516 (-) Transcript_14342:30-1577(-)
MNDKFDCNQDGVTSSTSASGDGQSSPDDESVEIIPDPLAMEEMWGKELLHLKYDEREANNDRVHGMKSWAVPETPEQNNRALNDMQTEINKLPLEEKRAHERGLELHSLYIQSKEYRLRFLRATRFDVKAAAYQYCKCQDYMSDLFGEVALRRRLFLTDLNDEELSYMREGQFQILPSRDCLGRRIIVFNFSKLARTYSIDVMFRVYVYMLYAIMSEDISTQRNGLVYIGMINKTRVRHENKGGLLRIRSMFEAMPLIWGAVHLCVPDLPVYRVTTGLFMTWIGAEGRQLMRIHRGNRIECCYSLRSFGIPVEDIPEMQTGHLKKENLLRLMKVRMTMDAFHKEQEMAMKRRRRKTAAPGAMKPFMGIECPEINFLVLGSSKSVGCKHSKHVGNITFRNILFANEGFKGYLQDHKGHEKGCGGNAGIKTIAEAIIHESFLQGLHFVEYMPEEGFYKEIISLEDLRQQVEEAMKRHRRKYRAVSLARNKTRENSGANAPVIAPFDLSLKKSGGCLG